MISVPSPVSLSYFWNFGSLLGVFLAIQIISGFVLSMHYSSELTYAFSSVIEISEDISFGWLLRSIHANGASFFFFLLYFHIARGIYYKSYKSKLTWVSGTFIFLSSMGVAFLGYVLPWGQMSFWGATVITNLLSTFPFGEDIVRWIWGGFSVSGPTLSRFFSIHYILPFVISVLVMIHILFLHEKGSQNPLGVSIQSYKISFHPAFTVKDLVGFISVGGVFLFICVIYPWGFMDPDNFSEANAMVTPLHIQPEWYFLFAYAILRSIPNKLGGVVALFSSVAILFVLPTLVGAGKFSSSSKILFWFFCSTFTLLTWLGSMPAEGLLITFGQVLSFVYFSTILVLPIL